LKRLNDILKHADVIEIKGSTDLMMHNVSFDSRNTGPNSLFIAVKGTQADGHQYIEQAVANGAIAVICEQFPISAPTSVTFIKVKNSAQTLGIAAANFYDNPADKLCLVGITGTNGKTTIATLLYELFTRLGFACGLLSTIRVLVHGQEIAATHTTPDAIQINKMLKEMVDTGCAYCFMEVSSHAVEQCRTAGLHFAGGVFTNLTHDHLDYHPTFADYLKAKKLFFDDLRKDAFALTNIDDKNGRVIVQNTKADISSYSLKSLADYKCKVLESHFEGLKLQIDGNEFHSSLIGYFNAYNLLAVYATALLLGQDKENVLMALSMLGSVEGRFEHIISPENIIGIIDYAHTPDALKNVLETIKQVRFGNEQMITVVGAGGDRDRSKRAVMANIAATLSDRVILTADNPRSENPDAIIEEMQKGIDDKKSTSVLAITNREEAIKTACALAKPGDIILVAGKGHEKYQEIKGVKHPFDDKKVLEKYLMNTI